MTRPINIRPAIQQLPAALSKKAEEEIIHTTLKYFTDNLARLPSNYLGTTETFSLSCLYNKTSSANVQKAAQLLLDKVQHSKKMKTSSIAEHAAHMSHAFAASRRLKETNAPIPLFVATESRNDVYIDTASQSVFKSGRDVAKNEGLAISAASFLGFSKDLHPSHTTTASSTILEDSYDDTVGNIQPFIQRNVLCSIIEEDEELFFKLVQRLDKKDTQEKTILQGLIGNQDLHTGNAMMVPVINEEYTEYESHTEWKYKDSAGHWKEVSSLQDLSFLYYKGSITSDTIVKSSGVTEQKLCDTNLPKALDIPWKLALFDNEESFPKSNNLLSYRGATILPCQVFTTGLSSSKEPLSPATIAKMKNLSTRSPALKDYLMTGSSPLWHKLTPTTKEMLKKHLSEKYTDENVDFLNVIKGLPHKLMASVVKEIMGTKVSEIDCSDEDKEYFSVFQKQLTTFLSKTKEAISSPEDMELYEILSTASQALQRYLENISTDIREASTLLDDFNMSLQDLEYDIPTLFDEESERHDLLSMYSDIQEQFTSLYERLESSPSVDKKFSLVEKMTHMKPALTMDKQNALFERIEKVQGYITSCEEASQKPTVLGAFNAMYPSYGRFYDILEKTHRATGEREEMITLQTSSSLGHFESDCYEILNKGLEAGVFAAGKEDPEYKAALADLEEFNG
jgi:hypothetical protein